MSDSSSQDKDNKEQPKGQPKGQPKEKKSLGQKIISPFTGMAKGYKEMSDAWSQKAQIKQEYENKKLKNEETDKKWQATAAEYEADPVAQNKKFGGAV